MKNLITTPFYTVFYSKLMNKPFKKRYKDCLKSLQENNKYFKDKVQTLELKALLTEVNEQLNTNEMLSTDNLLEIHHKIVKSTFIKSAKIL